ncbi:FecR family protein [Chitinophaga sp. 22321]|uniref:FecR family protein n=1 Tax=Chitinophaga hostae TaxID=2831022 RepID=A0ABS5JAL0_9BACT|nr:FecR family protein [Chitinophaga hostae]MBS0032254.1 FecR family protein [Chitinophaga hostae]
MDSSEEKINELLLDNRFVDWVINPNSPYAGYWQEWLAMDASHVQLAAEARKFLLMVQLAEEEDTDPIGEEGLEQMLDHIKTAATVKKSRSYRMIYRGIAAAAVVAGLVLLVKWLQHPAPLTSPETEKQMAYNGEVIRYNGNKEDELLFLPDGSKIVLSSGARVAYNLLMNGDKREVTLSGEAYFDIAKNPQQPFYIYTDKVVVKVLGTSFRVTSSGQQESVAVASGKVSVYLKGQDLEQSAAKIVLPKQVCTYSREQATLVTTMMADLPVITAKLGKSNGLNFEDAHLDTVIKTLEKMYAIPITYNADVFANCYITVSLGNESLEDILKVITKTIDASYTISNYGIIIKGNGCR